MAARPPFDLAARLAMARGHLSNIEAHGNAEANAVLVIRNVLAELEAAIAASHMPAGDGVAAIAAERRRQVEAEGWTPEHDDAHPAGEMAWAAAAYCFGVSKLGGAVQFGKHFLPWCEKIWPWAEDWWKPADRIRNLEKAGALIAAEIDRLKRAAARAGSDGRG